MAPGALICRAPPISAAIAGSGIRSRLAAVDTFPEVPGNCLGVRNVRKPDSRLPR